MIRIALVGDIGSGKSHIAKLFNFPLFNADLEVAKIYKTNKQCFKKLKKMLPKYFSSFPIQKEEIIRAVLVKLPSGGEVKQHWDLGSESFRNHPRIHMAVQTNQYVNFNVGGEDKHMKLGEFWEINNFAKQHGVHNHGDTDRIHLILDLKKAPISLF